MRTRAKRFLSIILLPAGTPACCIVLITLVGLLWRLANPVGFMLPDDFAYLGLAEGIMRGEPPVVPTIGQYEYRPLWIYPLAASISLFGWNALSISFYNLISGALLPGLLGWWLRRYLGPASWAPVWAAAIMATHPSLVPNSLVLANEVPMLAWCLLCVNLFGLTWHRLTSPRLPAKPGRAATATILLATLAGTSFACAYQVKSSAIPVLGMWLAFDWWWTLARDGRGPLASRWLVGLATAAFLLPLICLQAYYGHHTGHVFGNFIGEARLYESWIPDAYYKGEPVAVDLFTCYEQAVFGWTGYLDGYRYLLHGPWGWLGALALVLAWALRRRLPPGLARVWIGLGISSLVLFLFFQYWPARITPYYLPNCFSGRPTRYMDVIVPSLAGACGILLALPWWRRGWSTRITHAALIGGLFGLTGHSLYICTYNYLDRISDYSRASGLPLDAMLPQITDMSARYLFRNFGEPPEGTRFQEARTNELNLLDTGHAWIWTGGAHFEGLPPEGGLEPDMLRYDGGELTLIATWPADSRPWRRHALQLWRFNSDRPPTP